jgi:hypothetical protein
MRMRIQGFKDSSGMHKAGSAPSVPSLDREAATTRNKTPDLNFKLLLKL